MAGDVRRIEQRHATDNGSTHSPPRGVNKLPPVSSNPFLADAKKLVQQRQEEATAAAATVAATPPPSIGGDGDHGDDDDGMDHTAAARKPLPPPAAASGSKRKHSPIVWSRQQEEQEGDHDDAGHDDDDDDSNHNAAQQHPKGRPPKAARMVAFGDDVVTQHVDNTPPHSSGNTTPRDARHNGDHAASPHKDGDADTHRVGEQSPLGGSDRPARSGFSSRWADELDDVEPEPSVVQGGGMGEESEGPLPGPALPQGPLLDPAHVYGEVDGGMRGGSSGEEDEERGDDEGEGDEEDEDDEIPMPSMMNECRDVDCFERLNKINEGAYGVVFRARDKQTGRICALKKIKMDQAAKREGFPLTSVREINVMLSLKHPNIVNVNEVVMARHDLDSIFMVMEYMEHDLKHLADKRMTSPWALSEVKCLMQQLLSGVAYMHDQWVIHRDLKTSNLLYNSKGELKICDFGLARQFGDPVHKYTEVVVTLWYRAPELLLGTLKYGPAIDMWSIGCIMAEWLLKEPLFTAHKEIDMIRDQFKLLGAPTRKTWPELTSMRGYGAINFSIFPKRSKLREKFPKATPGRPGLSDAGFDLLSRLLAVNPADRIIANEALHHEWFREPPLGKDKVMMPTFPATNEHGNAPTGTVLGALGTNNKSPDPRAGHA